MAETSDAGSYVPSCRRAEIRHQLWTSLRLVVEDFLFDSILRQWLRDYRPAREGSGLPLPRKKYNAIKVKLFTSRKDTVRNLAYSCAHAPAQ